MEKKNNDVFVVKNLTNQRVVHILMIYYLYYILTSMKNASIKNIFIAGLTLLSFGFLSAQFIIPSGINNALQVIQRVLITTTGTSTGTVVMDSNTGSNKIYINPTLLSTTTSYNGQYVLTLDGSGYISFTTWASNISGASVSWGNLLITLNNGTTINAGTVTWPQWPLGPTGAKWSTGAQGIPWIQWIAWSPWVWITNIASNLPGTFTIYLSNGTDYTLNLPSGWSGGTDSQTLSLLGNILSISNWNFVNLGSLWFWSLLWNAGTNPTINFIGTTDNQDFVFKTNNTERMRILWASGYVGIGTQNPLYPLSVSGWILAQENEVIFFAWNNGINSLGVPIPGVFALVWDFYTVTWSYTLFTVYDDLTKKWFVLDSTAHTGANNTLENKADISANNWDNLDMEVELWLTGNNATWMASFKSSIDMDGYFMSLQVQGGVNYTANGTGWYNSTYTNGSNIDMTPGNIHMYGTGGSGYMVFDSMLGRFWFNTWAPGNIIHIASSIGNNTLGLRLSAMWGWYTNWVLWLDANQDVVPLAPLSSLQGGGWWPTSQYLKLGELDYTQLNGWDPTSLQTIQLTNGNPLPPNVVVKNIFVQVSTWFARAWFTTQSGVILCFACEIINFSLIGANNVFWWINDGAISTFSDSAGRWILNQWWTFNVPSTFFHPTQNNFTAYYIYPKYQTIWTYNDRVQWHASFVVEYETMPSLTF